MNRAGFTLTELLMASGITGIAIAGSLSVLFVCNRSWHNADVQIRSASEATSILEKMVHGVGGTNGLRTAIQTNVTVAVTNGQWTIGYKTWDQMSYRIAYFPTNKTIMFTNATSGGRAIPLGTHVVASAVTNMTNANSVGMSINISVGVQDGRFAATNNMSTFVHYRN